MKANDIISIFRNHLNLKEDKNSSDDNKKASGILSREILEAALQPSLPNLQSASIVRMNFYFNIYFIYVYPASGCREKNY